MVWLLTVSLALANCPADPAGPSAAQDGAAHALADRDGAGAGRPRTSQARTISATSDAVLGGGLHASPRARDNASIDPSRPEIELDQLRGRTNTRYYAGAGLGVLALGAGVGAAVVGSW